MHWRRLKTNHLDKNLILTPRCQINESTRLSFLDFPLTLYLDISYHISHPNRLFGPTHFAFPPYSLFGPIFYEIYIEYPPYSFIRPYSFIMHLRVVAMIMNYDLC